MAARTAFRDALSSTPEEPQVTPEAPAADVEAPAGAASSDVPRNMVLRVLFYTAGIVLWIVWGVAKVLFFVGVIVLFVVISLLELVLELAVMPLVLLLRVVGGARWPAEITRQGKHFATKHATDAAQAATLRDELAQQLEGGTPPDGRMSTQ